ncbi:FliI/YscN family ATPase [Nocardioides deserti]|uniref:FliI/YscN family ATPase n=2 Tax=Nocardioides deserti TaxID=1588644 RepID=A0ABR6UD92_9ACTN|nr:FliI/YscN family ATPase [Nocardioides deserti]
MLGLHLRVTGLRAAVGDLVEVLGPRPLLAEVAASSTQALTCLPLGDTRGLGIGAVVRHTGGPLRIRVGEQLTGRVLDGLGRPVDGGPDLRGLAQVTVDQDAPDALSRPRIDHQLRLGVRALDALVPCGRGQRLGIMAGSGVGKSSLLSMIARGTDAEVSVIALVGERGREVREFLENDLGPEGLARSVVVVATSDAPPVERLRAAFVATRIAEWFRDAGRHVVLMMDSLTRVAMAQREIGLSAGEPPATRGYPPSVFGLLPRLLERAGTSPSGSITGLYTVLVEGDDLQDPVGDTARSILDGHVVLSRRLATSGHFPSIDVLESISRVTSAVTSGAHQEDATRLRRMLAAHRDVKELVEIGAYVAGSDADADAAIARMPRIDAFLRQGMSESTPLDETRTALHELVAP